VEQNNEEHIVAGPDEHRIFIDISSVKHGPEKKKLVSRLYWMLMVIELMNLKCQSFSTERMNCQKRQAK
jgi:hypothetical protein